MRAAALLGLLSLSVPCIAGAHPLRLDQPVLDHVAEIRARNPELRENAFSKMGGSSVASKAFLYCFTTPYVDLGEHQDLAATIEFFHTGRRSSFDRQSEAAGVSWNLRYVLSGRPANFRKELQATQGRWALVLFGGNDAQNQNERIYLKRLVYLLEEMEEMGVVPVLGSALPRRNKTRNRWIDRFNLITQAVAEHWALPYIDYNAALDALPRRGLAKDGVHPNVLPPGGFRTACQLTEKGLRYGNNVRNLLTLEMLDALRRGVAMAPDPVPEVVTDDVPRSDAGVDAGRTADAGAALDLEIAKPPDPLPMSELVDKAALPPAADLPKGCGSPRPGARHYRTSLQIHERTRLRASALDWDGPPPRVFLVRRDEETGPRCVRRRTQTAEVDARPGMWDLIVEVPARGAEEGQMLVLVARNPR